MAEYFLRHASGQDLVGLPLKEMSKIRHDFVLNSGSHDLGNAPGLLTQCPH